MWPFSKPEIEYPEEPPLEMLIKHNLYCPKCHEIQDFQECTPLTYNNCFECNEEFFVPYHMGEFWLYKPIGEGGMGCVYKAVPTFDSDFEFAVKILPQEKLEDPYLIASLLEESRIGESFGKHAHLAAVVGYGEDKGEYFCALEFVPGKTLDQLVATEGEIDQKRVIKWGLHLLSAEQRIYDTGYLYRDLKPQNVIIDNNDSACLIDYGLCVQHKNVEKLNQGDDLQGSPHFMPPERILGNPEDMRGEIYSLGMLLFYALAKKTYYTPTEISSLVKKHVVSLRFSSVETRLPSNVKPMIANVIDNMIARDPNHRYESFVEVAKEFKSIYKQL